MLYKTCPKCNCNIPYEKQYCEICEKIHDRDLKVYKSRMNKQYNIDIRDKESIDFYHSVAWTRLTALCKDRYKNLDIYSYYYDHKIEYGEICHHIEEVSKNKDRVLDIDNLIYVTREHHNEIHSMYKKNYGGMKQILFNLIDRWNNEMKL